MSVTDAVKVVTAEQLMATTGGRDPILDDLNAAIQALMRLNGLEVAGRTMMTFMRGHMAEVRRDRGAAEYFHNFYDDMGREFLQFDDYDFVVHHCVRYQFWHLKEELDLLREGQLGAALAKLGAPLPEIQTPTTQGRRPPIATGWYEDTYRDLEAGRLPGMRGVANEVMPLEACVMRDPMQLDLIWPQFLIWCGETWGRQIVAMWDLLKPIIRMRRLLEERLTEPVLGELTARGGLAYREASQEFVLQYQEWHAFHAATVDVHDPMFDENLEGLFEWAANLAPDISAWGIKDVTKDEMYRELATTVLSLRGQLTAVEIPEFHYWRHTQFVPDCNRIGARGMPPFEAAEF